MEYSDAHVVELQSFWMSEIADLSIVSGLCVAYSGLTRSLKFMQTAEHTITSSTLSKNAITSRSGIRLMWWPKSLTQHLFKTLSTLPQMISKTENFARNKSNSYWKVKRTTYSQVVTDKHTDLRSAKVKRRQTATMMTVTMIWSTWLCYRIKQTLSIITIIQCRRFTVRNFLTLNR